MTHVFLPRPPLSRLRKSVRLACVRHAASVYPEPGSNSPFSFLSPVSSQRRNDRSQATQAQCCTLACSRRLLFLLRIDRNCLYRVLCAHVVSPHLLPDQETSTVPVLLSTFQLFKVLFDADLSARSTLSVYPRGQVRLS